jgi:hypothetical protein
LTQFDLDFLYAENATPLSILQKFLTSSMIETISQESQRYVNQTRTARQNSFKGYETFAVDEFWRFLAVQMMMGVIHKPALKDYWSTDPLLTTPFFGSVMSRNR